MTVAPLKGPEAKQAAKNSALILSTGGVGAVLGVWFSNVLRDKPELLVQLLSNFGPMFVIVVVLIYLADKHAGRFIETHKDNALATQRMATAIETIAKRDDEWKREIGLILGPLARDTQKVLGRVGQIDERLEQIDDRVGRIEDRLNEPRAKTQHAG